MTDGLWDFPAELRATIKTFLKNRRIPSSPVSGSFWALLPFSSLLMICSSQTFVPSSKEITLAEPSARRKWSSRVRNRKVTKPVWSEPAIWAIG